MTEEILNDTQRLKLLLSDLSASGFLVSPDVEVRVTGLFLNLTISRFRPRNNRRLGNLLGPLVCRSAEEQEEFHRIFAYWFPETDQAAYGDGVQAVIDSDQEESIRQARAEAEAEATRLRREREIREFWKTIRSVTPIIVTILVLSIALQMLLPHFAAKVSHNNAADRPTTEKQPETASTQDGKTQPSQPSQPISELFNKFSSWAYMSFVDLIESTSSKLKAIEHVLGPATTLVIMIPLGILALLIASSRRLLHAYAKRTQIKTRTQFRRLLSQGIANMTLLDKKFYSNVQPLRRRIRTNSNVLDVERTIEATASAGGLFTAQFSDYSASPEYLVLLDRRSENDHFATLAEIFSQHMALAGVHVTTYTFDRDPRIVSLAGSGRVIHLEELLRPDFGIRLMIFSDLSGFYDSSVGRPREFCQTQLVGISTVLITPKAIQDWGRKEKLIMQVTGAAIVPANQSGIAAAAALFDEEAHKTTSFGASQGPLFPERNRLAGLFAVGDWRWIGDLEPRAASVGGMIKQLKNELSENAWFWLASLAVYPLIYWRLTLYLAAHLTSEKNTAIYSQSALLEIVRLPWLVRGKMPPWLRQRFIKELSLTQRQQVRTVLESLLITVVTREEKDAVLGISFSESEESLHRRRRRLPDTEEHSRDSILIDFMTTREASEEDFSLTDKVSAALGIPQANSMLRSVFGGAELEAVHSASRECAKLVENSPPSSIEVNPLPVDKYGHGVFEIVRVATSQTDSLDLKQTFLLFRANPNHDHYRLVDEYSMNVLMMRKRLYRRFSISTLVILTILISVLYANWFPDLNRPSRDIAMPIEMIAYFLAGIFFAPFYAYWWLIYRPFSKVLRTFPTISQKLVLIQRRSKDTP